VTAEPNQGAAGDAPDATTTQQPSGDAGPAGAGAPVNQGAAGAGPAGSSAYEPGAVAYGESPASVGTTSDAFDQHPELFVGAAFLGGFALAQILKRVAQ
jgi:hypothetical protein